jgi:hypothetical protein
LDGTGAPSAEAIPEAPTQPQGEIHANKTKKNQTNPRKSPWIFLDSFRRFGAFQWVTANPNKKNLVPVSGCVPNVST